MERWSIQQEIQTFGTYITSRIFTYYESSPVLDWPACKGKLLMNLNPNIIPVKEFIVLWIKDHALMETAGQFSLYLATYTRILKTRGLSARMMFRGCVDVMARIVAHDIVCLHSEYPASRHAHTQLERGVMQVAIQKQILLDERQLLHFQKDAVLRC